MAVGTPSLRNLYYGMLFYNDDLTDCFWASQTSEQKRKEISEGQTPQLTFNNISWRAGRYNARVFFSNVELIESSYLITNASGIRLFLPSMDTPKTVDVYNGSTSAITLELSIKASPRGASCLIKNNRPTSASLTSCKFDIDNFGMYLEGLNTPVTIEPFMSHTVTIENTLVSTFKVQVSVDGLVYEATY
jgi:hypothetical protein